MPASLNRTKRTHATGACAPFYTVAGSSGPTRWSFGPGWLFAASLALLLASSIPLARLAVAQEPALEVYSLDDIELGLTKDDLALELLGSGVTLIGTADFIGTAPAAGIFEGGTEIIGFEQGIILSSGRAADVVGPNSYEDWTSEFSLPGYEYLNQLTGTDEYGAHYSTLDAAVLEFEFDAGATATQIFFNYVFGSEEYNEFVGSEFNDVFAFYVNGTNCAVIPGDDDSYWPVTINTINNGRPEGYYGGYYFPEVAATNPHLYINNAPFYPDLVGTADTLLNIEMDGFTVALTCVAQAVPGTNTMRIAIADTSDYALDSWVLIRSGSLTIYECGNGILEGTEECDDEDNEDGDGCNAFCEVEYGFTCDTSEPSICESECGDGMLASDEECDDGDDDDGDGCSSTCEIEDGYTCEGEGDPENPGTETDPDSLCDDVNECEEEIDDCIATATCNNTAGGYECLCPDGYDGDGRTGGTGCTDIDECTLGTDNCDANATCTNTVGSFTCTCNAGYTGDGTTCADINECTAGVGGHDACAANADCSNSIGSFTCECADGYTGTDPYYGGACTDIDECTDGVDDHDACAANADCTNTAGSFTCECADGYTGTDAYYGGACTDIDECTAQTDNCAEDATCANTDGSFTCTCNDGFTGNGVNCTDIDECTDGVGDHDACAANADCTNTAGSFTCECADGYTGTDAYYGGACTDIDECTLGTDNCDDNATCTNTDGSFDCTCNAGYTGDGVTCTDIDECTLGTDNCDENATCTNTAGGFTCTCNTGYTGDGVTCTSVCGDGIVVGGEACDDDNTTAGDGCSSTCQVEEGWVCSDSPSVCLPDRDEDGVADATDNCPSVYNPDQADSSQDGIGDACEVYLSGGGPGCSMGTLPGSAGLQLWWLAGLGLVVLYRRRQR